MENNGAARSCGILSATEAKPMSGFAKTVFASERQAATPVCHMADKTGPAEGEDGSEQDTGVDKRTERNVEDC
jgi:hypothetical protein